MKGRGLPVSLLGLLAVTLRFATEVVGADSSKDLGSVLGAQDDLSTYFNLIKVRVHCSVAAYKFI